MTVSVVVAVYNGARYLSEALDSVFREPEITEVVVVDDGSTDETAEVLAAYEGRMRVIHQAHAGQAAALNRGVAAATGALLTFQDADDIWCPGRMAALSGALSAHHDAACGCIEQFLSPDLDPGSARLVRLVQSAAPVPLLATTLFRQEAFDRVGPLDERLRTGAVIDWVSRGRAAGLRFATTPVITLRRRIHADNLGRRVGASARNADLLTVLRDHVHRRGSGNAGLGT